MKKTVLLFASLMVIASSSVCLGADKPKDNYRRSSLYSLMVLDTNISGASGTDAAEIEALTKSIPQLFEATPIPDKYDDHNVTPRTLTLAGLPSPAAEFTEIEKDGGSGNILDKYGISEKLGLAKDSEVVAKLLTLFKQNHTAQQMIYKWYINPEGTAFSPDYLLNERAANSRTTEEQAKFQDLSASDRGKLLSKISDDLINKTFIMVNVYSFKSAETIKELLNVAILGNAGDNPIAKAAAQKAFELATKNLKGYMCCYKTYLFKVNFNETDFSEKWAEANPKDFLNSDFGSITYVGKTSGMRPVVSTKDANTLLQLATERMIDTSVAQLQKNYEDFKTLSTLRVADDGKTLISYIGMKEGLEGKEKFEVLEKMEDEEGNVTYKSIGTVEVVKGRVWDNRAGAGNADLNANDEDKSDSDASLTATEFKGNAAKFANHLIRQKK